MTPLAPFAPRRLAHVFSLEDPFDLGLFGRCKPFCFSSGPLFRAFLQRACQPLSLRASIRDVHASGIFFFFFLFLAGPAQNWCNALSLPSFDRPLDGVVLWTLGIASFPQKIRSGLPSFPFLFRFHSDMRHTEFPTNSPVVALLRPRLNETLPFEAHLPGEVISFRRTCFLLTHVEVAPCPFPPRCGETTFFPQLFLCLVTPTDRKTFFSFHFFGSPP